MPQLNFSIPPDLLDRIDALKPNYLDRKGFLCLLLESALDMGLDTASKLPAYRVGAGTQNIELGHSPVPAVQAAPAAQQDVETADAAHQKTVADDGLPGFEKLALALEPKIEGGCGGKQKIDPYGRRALDLDLIPDDLLDCQQLLPEFWAAKKGTRSQTVFTRVCNKLRQWDPDQRREALERAIASGWGDVFEPPSVRAVAGTGYVDSITRDRIERDKFLAMFQPAQEAA